jgi:hypothetical protein
MITGKIFLILIQLNVLIFVINAKNTTGLERLFNHIFNIEDYVNIVRPTSADSLTHISTELKLLQIDLVIYFNEYLNFFFI